MSELVVYGLEAIEIDVQHGCSSVVSSRTSKSCFKAIMEEGPIGETCKRVMARSMLHTLCCPLAFIINSVIDPFRGEGQQDDGTCDHTHNGSNSRFSAAGSR